MPVLPKRTGLPLIADADLANTLDFHVASTNFLSIVDDYANYIAATYVWNFARHTVDPVAHQASFLNELNSGTFDARNSSEGGVNEKVRSEMLASYKLAKLDTLLKPTEIWIRGENNLPETKTEIKGDPGTPLERSPSVTQYLALDLLTGKERWIVYNEDLKSVVDSKIELLETAWGLDSADEEFVLDWIKKYRYAHDKVKSHYESLVTDDTRNYFAKFSDSIGALARMPENVDSTTIPVVDIDFNLLGTTPSVIPAVISDKIDPETQFLLVEMSNKTNSLFRQNLRNVLTIASNENAAHGQDLMTDYLHWMRMVLLQGDANGLLADGLGNLYRILTFVQTSENKQITRSPIFDIVVEDSIVKVDILKNRIKTLADIGARNTNDKALKASSSNLASQS